MPSLTFEEAYPVLYRGWDETAARADFTATGGRNKAGYAELVGGTTGGDQDIGSTVNKAIEDSFNKLNIEVSKRFGEYRGGKPFRIDEILAEKVAQAKEQIDPYYNETLTDYLTGIERKISRGTQDTRDLLSELQADIGSYSRDIKFSLDQALNKAREGFAGAGLFESGERFRAEGILERRSGEQLSDYLRKQAFREKSIGTGLQRSLEEIGTAKTQTVRDIERQRLTDVETRKAQLAKEEGQRYITGFRATLPPELSATQNFDLLADLGIYS